MPKKTPESRPEGIVELKLAWVGLDETPVHTANHFVSQFDETLFYLAFGLATPPLLLGSPEERRQQAEQIDVVPIDALARVALTPRAMGQLIDVLQRNMKAWEERHHVAPQEREGK